MSAPSAIPTATPPWSPEAETALLAVVLMRSDDFAEVEDIVSVGDFYGAANGLTWAAMLNIRRRNETIDIPTLRDELARCGTFERVGGDGFILSLDGAVAIAPPEQYARTVREFAVRRSAIGTFRAQMLAGYNLDIDTRTYIERAEAEVLHALDVSTSVAEVSDARSSLLRFWERAVRVKAAGGLLGVRSGIASLDAYLGGFWCEQLSILGGRPSMGKTALLETCSVNALEAGERPLFFSLEMPESLLWPRLLAKVTEIDSVAIREQTLTRDGFDSLSAAMAWFRDSHFRLVAKSGLSIGQIRSIARKEVKQHGVNAIYVDYLQKIRSSRRHSSREQEVAEVSNGLAELARELNVPVIAGAQINRGNAARADKRPTLSDLRESGAIENDADNVVLIHREAYYRREQVDAGERAQNEHETFDVGAAELIVGKNRNGATGTAFTRYEAELCRFVGARPSGS